MPAEAVAFDIEQRGPLPRDQPRPLARHGIGDGKGVRAVHRLGVERAGRDPRADARQTLPPHRLAHGLAAHGVEVVGEEEEDRQPLPAAVLPEPPELAHGGEVHRLPHRAAACRAVARMGDRDRAVLRQPPPQCRPRRDPRRGADDGVVGIAAERRKEGVHRSAHAPVEAVRAHEDLGKEAIEQEILGHRAASPPEDPPHLVAQPPAVMGGEDRLDPGLGQPRDGGEALGQKLAMAAVRAEDVVGRVERERRAHRRPLLPDREMRRPLVDMRDPAMAAGGLEGCEHPLELADHHHVAQHVAQGGRPAGRDLRAHRARIGVHRQGGRRDRSGPQYEGGIDQKFLGHRATPAKGDPEMVDERTLVNHPEQLLRTGQGQETPTGPGPVRACRSDPLRRPWAARAGATRAVARWWARTGRPSAGPRRAGSSGRG